MTNRRPKSMTNRGRKSMTNRRRKSMTNRQTTKNERTNNSPHNTTSKTRGRCIRTPERFEFIECKLFISVISKKCLKIPKGQQKP